MTARGGIVGPRSQSPSSEERREGRVPNNRFRWLVCALLFAGTTINYIDRQVIGLLKPTLMADLGWSQIDYGDIVFAFQAAYAIGYGGGGWFMDDQNPNFIIPGFADGANRDLRGTHPISIAYHSAADTKLRPKRTTMGTSGTIANVLDQDKVQCSSCHDVHDQESVAGTSLLRVAQTVAQGGNPSGLCLTCHVK